MSVVFNSKTYYYLFNKIMSVVPSEFYELFVFDNGETKWELRGEFTSDLVAGMILAVKLVEIMNKGIYHYEDITIRNKNKIHGLIPSYTIAEMVSEDKIKHYFPDHDMYGWRFHIENVYSLYQFKYPEFIQGFITICEYYNLDFRMFVSGTPFKGSDIDTITNYDISGYDIKPFELKQRIITPLIPFYSY